ncbi:Werner syndrome ATP-dependent helicase [Fulvia fulva]|nr:Werner syndrome ATP-dependent helicase [Fulvia fulva]
MSGGNGLLGMSFSAPIFADAAHRVRPGSVALACEGASAASPRLPSTRPIDQRWDRSRGIISSNARRTIARDHTWSPTHGIIFGNIPASTRYYATNPVFAKKKPLATDSAATTSTGTTASDHATKAGWAGDNVHRAPSMSMNQVEATQLRSKNSQLESDIKSRDNEIIQLKKHGDTQQDKIKQMQSDFEDKIKRMQSDFELQKRTLEEKRQAETSKLEKRRQAETSKLRAELYAQTKFLADAEPSAQNIENQRAIARDETRRQVEAVMRWQHEIQIKELKESYAQQIATAVENSQVLTEARNQNALLAAQHEQERVRHREAMEKVQAEVKSATKEIAEHKHLSSYFQRQYSARQSRAKTDRDSYITYRNIFDDVHDAAHDTMTKLLFLARLLQSEARLWRRSASTFQNTKHLHLFRQTSKHNVIRKSINNFLEERSAHAELGAGNIIQLATQLRADAQAFKGPAHMSRKLTRLLHYDEEHTAFDLVDAAFHIATVLPFRQRRKECDGRISQIQAEVSNSEQSGQTVDPALRQELVVLRDRRAATIRLLSLFELIRRMKAYEALLHDTPVEKAVFLRTADAFEEFSQVQDMYLGLFERLQASSNESRIDQKDRMDLRRKFRYEETKANTALDELRVQARNRCVLEQELDQLTDTEQAEADREIKRRIERLVGQQNDLIDQLLPSMRSIGRQTRASLMRASSMDDRKAKLPGGVSAAKSTRLIPLTKLETALRTPLKRRTPEQALMIAEKTLGTKQRSFMREISREALESVADDQAQDLHGLSRRIARLKPRVHADNRRSLKLWKELEERYRQRRKAVASLLNREPGSVEVFDATITAIASNIATLKIELKAGVIAAGAPGSEGSSNGGSNNGGSSNGGSSNGDSSNGVSDVKRSESDGTPAANAIAVEPEVRIESVNPPASHAEGDSGSAQGPTASPAAPGSTNTNRTWTIAPAKKSRRERFPVRKQTTDNTSMDGLIAKLGAKAANVSGGASADALSGGLKLKPTAPKRSQHSLFASPSFSVRAVHKSTAFSRRTFTAAASDADSLSHLQEADLDALDEAFSTMPSLPTDPTTPHEEMIRSTHESAPVARSQGAMPPTAQSTPAPGDTLEDEASGYSPGIAPSVESPGSVAPDSSPAESNDVDVELTYNIPAQDFRAAIMASPNSSAAFWSHRLYRGTDGKQPAVMYCKSFEVAERQARLFTNENVLGFDLEWEPQTSIKTGHIKRNVSLIQIAAEDKIALFQIALFKGDTAEELMPPTLKAILESADVVKAGVNVVGDARRVRELLNIDMKGVFELSHMYRVVKYSEQERKNVSFKLVSLASQVQDILMLPLKKDDNRVSAWSRELNTQQTDYAASDAYAGFRLYHKLDEMRKSMDPMPPRPGFLEQELPLTLGDGTEVYKSSWKASGRKTAATSKGVDVEEEEDEFFDAIEEQNANDLTAKMESLDIAGDDGATTSTVTYPTLPQLDTEQPAEDANASPAAEAPQDEGPQPRAEATRQSARPDTTELKAADAWVTDWRFSLPPDWTVSARSFELRAYHLWHHQGFALKEVAAICREPPLALTTVASYVMQALKEENLPYDPERVRDPRDILPTSVHRRYQKIFDRIPK